MKVVTEVLDTLVSEVPVVMPPGKLLLHVPAGLQGGQGLDNLEEGNIAKVTGDVQDIPEG